MRRLIAAGLLVWLATFAAVVAVQVLWADAGPPGERADSIICLGAGMVSKTSPLPDTASAGRAASCAALYRAGVAPVVVFTGYGNETRSAAAAMAEIAGAQGVPADAIRIEPDARSTWQNAGFGLPLATADGAMPGRVILVSQAFHLPRAWVIFRAAGAEDVTLHASTGDPPGVLGMLRWTVRETLAIWSNAGRLAVYAAAGALGIDRDTRIGWFN